jgi:hypothetical protein
MTHTNIALSEKFNLLIKNEFRNFTISKLFVILKTTSLSIIFVLSCPVFHVDAQSPQFAIQQSKAHLTKAEWFLDLPQFNKDSAEIYFDRAINELNNNEPKHFQAFSEAYFKLHYYFYRSHFATHFTFDTTVRRQINL